jgi:hypothetical protein
MKIKLMPDHLSTGLWNESGANIEVPPYLTSHDKELLKIWHDHWEILANQAFMKENHQTNEPLKKWFLGFSQLMINRLNSYGLDEYTLCRESALEV